MYVTACLSHWFGKSKDIYNCQDKAVPLLSQSKLYKHLTVLKTVRIDLLVKRDIPDGCSGKALALM